MGVFKEEARFLEDLMRQQRQIWPDSCDAGVDATNSLKAQMKQVIESLIVLPGSYLEFKSNMPAVQRTWKLLICWEMDRGDMLYRGTEYTVGYYKDSKKEFFSIESENVSLTEQQVAQRTEKRGLGSSN